MEKFVVESFGTLHKDVLVEAEDMEEAQEKVKRAFEEGILTFSMDDFVGDLFDFDVLTPEDAEAIDGIKAEDCTVLEA